MSDNTLPLIIEPETLIPLLSNDNLLIVDLGSEQSYAAGHIPGAVHVSPRELVQGTPSAPGELPGSEQLNALFSRLGLSENTHVVVYDDEGGGWAGRFIWTLDVIGHERCSYLNGGIWAWRSADGPLAQETTIPTPRPVELTIHREPIMNKEAILERLQDPHFVVWDARTAAEYCGQKMTARRDGHIPGAIHCEWTELMDRNADLRIRPDAREYLEKKGLTADKTIVTHCQTHHRSGLTYLVGKSLSFDIKAYPGSWVEWGNDPTTPVEQ
jgi:thiosulfate/3-mercaptopyruvate sulfurtransferase